MVLKHHLARLDKQPKVTQQNTTLWSDKAIGSKAAALIFWKNCGEVKRKSIRENDLCLAEKKGVIFHGWVKGTPYIY